MKFSTREDIEAPVDHVFDRVSDFEGFERKALRHGASITRNHDNPQEVGGAWDIAFTYRGRDRRMTSVLERYDRPNGFFVMTTARGLSIATQVDVVALSRGRTRLAVSMDLRAKSLTARLLLQSMKLAKGKLVKRYKARVLEFAEDIADDYRKAQQG